MSRASGSSATASSSEDLLAPRYNELLHTRVSYDHFILRGKLRPIDRMRNSGFQFSPKAVENSYETRGKLGMWFASSGEVTDEQQGTSYGKANAVVVS